MRRRIQSIRWDKFPTVEQAIEIKDYLNDTEWLPNEQELMMFYLKWGEYIAEVDYADDV